MHRRLSHHGRFCVLCLFDKMVQDSQVTNRPQWGWQAWLGPLQHDQQEGKQSCDHRQQKGVNDWSSNGKKEQKAANFREFKDQEEPHV